MSLKQKLNIQNLMEETSQYVMNTYNRAPIAFISGSDSEIIDTTGREYIDFASGIAVNIFGHGNKRLVNSLKKAASNVWHTSNLYYIINQTAVAKVLNKQGLKGKSFFCNSGAEANEAALKLAFKHASKISSEKTEIVALVGSFHGRTLGALSVTGQDKYRQNFPAPCAVKFVKMNDTESLRKAINKNTAALIVELIQGESGVHQISEEFYKVCRKLTKKHKAVFIIDEVQTGVGRTGELFAFKHYNGTPDVVTMAKGAASGLPIGIMHASKQYSDVFEPGDHASTFGGNHIVTAVALSVLKTVTKKSFLENVRIRAEYLRKKLEDLKKTHSAIKEIRGLGFMLAIDISKDVKSVVKACREDGLLLIGAEEHTVRILPPITATKEEIDKAMTILSKHL